MKDIIFGSYFSLFDLILWLGFGILTGVDMMSRNHKRRRNHEQS